MTRTTLADQPVKRLGEDQRHVASDKEPAGIRYPTHRRQHARHGASYARDVRDPVKGER